MIDLGIGGLEPSALDLFDLEQIPASKKLIVDDSLKGAQSKIAQKRKSVDIVIAKTASRKKLMNYLSDTRVDVVFPDPSKIKIDTSVANMARDNKIAIGFSFADIRYSKFKMRRIVKCAETLMRKKCMVVLSSGAKQKDDLRDLESVAALFEKLGFSHEFLRDSLENTPQKLLLRNKNRGIMPGVRLV